MQQTNCIGNGQEGRFPHCTCRPDHRRQRIVLAGVREMLRAVQPDDFGDVLAAHLLAVQARFAQPWPKMAKLLHYFPTLAGVFQWNGRQGRQQVHDTVAMTRLATLRRWPLLRR